MKKFNALRDSLMAALILGVSAVQAAVPESVTTETTAYKTDGLAIIAALMSAGIAIWGAQKLGRKFGWI